MKKRFIVVLLSAMLIVVMMPSTAFASSAPTLYVGGGKCASKTLDVYQQEDIGNWTSPWYKNGVTLIVTKNTKVRMNLNHGAEVVWCSNSGFDYVPLTGRNSTRTLKKGKYYLDIIMDKNSSYHTYTLTLDDMSAKPANTVGTPKLKTSGLTGIKLSWNKVGNATGYKVYRYNSSTKKWSCVKTLSGKSTTTWTNKGLKLGKTYKYKVAAYNKFGIGPKSNAAAKALRKNIYTNEYLVQDVFEPNGIVTVTKGYYSGGNLVLNMTIDNWRDEVLKIDEGMIKVKTTSNKLLAEQWFDNLEIEIMPKESKKFTLTFDEGTTIENYNLRDTDFLQLIYVD